MFTTGQIVIKAIHIGPKVTYHITRIKAAGKKMMFDEDSGVPYDVETGKELFPIFKPSSGKYSEILPFSK